jgi:hypothetical protein
MSLQLIGAGLGRTGTASLKLALEQLGLGRCYHMGEIMENPSHPELWIDAAGGNPDWAKLLGPYGATVDFPACSFWRELADLYPDAKVLLSVRDVNSWFDSAQETILSEQLLAWVAASPLKEFMQKTVYYHFGDRIHDREFMVRFFEEHVEQVRSAISPERLLIYEIKEGWEPLCEFLGVPVPEEPFPRVNSRDETRRMIEGMIEGSSHRPLDEVLQERSKDLFRQ